MAKTAQSLAAMALLAVALAALSPGAVRAAELVMLEQAGCYWCARWDEEIGPIYPKTGEGNQAPLRRVDINQPWPEDLKNIRPERFTPTFVLVENGVEIDRIRGYPGEDFFWFLIGEMLKKLPQELESSG